VKIFRVNVKKRDMRRVGRQQRASDNFDIFCDKY